MKKITNSRIRSIITLFLVLFSGFVSYAQCTNGAAYLTVAATSTNANGQPQTIGTCTFYTEYNTVNSLLVGSPYIFTATNAGTNVYVTITDASNVVIAHGQSPLLVSNVTSATVRLHPSVDVLCTTSTNVCLTTTVQFLPACPSPNQLSVNTLTQTSAMATWNPLGTETAWDFQWGPTGFAIGSGTSVNNLSVAEYALTGLTQNTAYQFYVRAKCTTEDSNWNGPFTFTTLCNPIADFIQNFDSSPTGFSNTTPMPDCWFRGGTGTVYNNTGSLVPNSPPNRMRMFASGTAVPATESYVITPELSNLPAGTHRLKFKAYATVANRIMEVGYMTDASDISSYVFISEITLPGGLQSSTQEFTVVPGVLPATAKHLAFKNPGFPGSTTTLYIDDVKWEVNSSCVEPSALGTSAVTNQGFTATWTAGGPETAWEVQYGTTNFALGTGTIVQSAVNSALITGLLADTNYQYYVRAVCTGDVPSPWSGPFSVRTLCNDVAEFIQNFDSSPTGSNNLVVMPTCWTRGGNGTIYNTTGSVAPMSAPNRMYLFASGTTPTEAYLISPPLSNLAAGTHRLKFKGYATILNRTVEVGYLTNPADISTFALIQSITLPGTAATTAQEFTVVPGVLPAGAKVIAFKNPGFPSSTTTMYLDDIKWEVNSSCVEPTALTSNGVSATTFTAAWTAGGPETAWEVQYGTSNFALGTGTIVPATASNVLISGLTADTNYQYYVRAVCTGDIPSPWSGPFSFKTLCQDVDLVTENFDSFTISTFSNLAPMPSCWNRGGNGTVYMTTSSVAPMSPSNRLYMFSSSTASPPTVGYAMLPPLSNLAAGTHRLKFKYYATLAGRTIDVGYFTNPADVNSFVVLQTITTPGTTAASAQEYIVVPTGVPAGTKVIGFRNNGFPSSSNTSYIDDVIWQQIPPCVIPTNISAVNIQKFQATVQLTAGNASQTAWDIEYGLDGFTPGTGTVLNTATTSTVVSGLLSSTAYQYYVTGLCGTDGNAITAGPFSFTTLCNYPDLDTTTPGTVCGLGTVNLSATSLIPTAGFEWYTAATGGVPVGNSASFTTPQISTTTPYFVSATSINPGTNVTLGNGALNSTFAAGSTFQHSWGGYKTQNLIRAEDLVAAGISAGPINSIAWELTTTGAVNRNDFSLSIGSSSAQFLTNTHQTGLTQVFTTTVLNLTTGVNTITFSTPFTWDGTSNIIIETCWSNENFGGSGASVIHDTTPYVSSTYTYADNRTAAEICATLTGGVPNAAGTNSGGTLTASQRPKFIFNATGVCRSPRQEVVATVTPADPIEASVSLTTVCAESPTVLSVTSINSNYTYVWTPGDLTGASVTVNPTATTTYTVTATDAATACSTSDTVTVNVNPLPTELIIANADNLETCIDSDPFMLSISGAQIDDVVLLTENFNGPTNNWTTENNSTANTPAQISNIAWTLRPNGHVAGVTYASNDASQFYLSDSDSGGSGSVTNVSLVSPIFSTQGFSQLTLSFWHFYQNIGTAKVQYSVNNNDWVDLQTYNTTQGASNNFVNANLIMPEATLGQSNVRIRFQYNANWGWRWAVDNVTLSGTAISNISWSPASELYIDEAATIPYVEGTNAATVYTTSDISIVYTATATSALGCTRTADLSVTVFATPAPTGLPIFIYCPTAGSTLADIAVSGTDIQWYATATSTTPLAPTNALSSGYYFATQTLNGCESQSRLAVFTIGIATPAPVVAPLQTFCLNATVADLTASGENLLWYATATGGEALDATTALVQGTYFVSQTTGGCESPRAAVAVNFNNVIAPMVSATAASCSGSGVATITNYDANATYVFVPSGPTVTGGIISGMTFGETYTVTSVSNGCESIVSNTFSVSEILPTPAAPSGDAIQAPLEGSTIEALVVVGENIVWYATEADALAGTNPLSASEVLQDETFYYATQTINGCTSAPFEVYVDLTLSSGGFDISQLKYYPNPVNQTLSISYSEVISNVKVINILGQTVLSSMQNSNFVSIEMTQLPAGSYMVQIESNDATTVIKVMKR